MAVVRERPALAAMPMMNVGCAMQTQTIPPDRWRTQLKKLSQSFEGWPVSLDIMPMSNGRLREFRQVPLLGITTEPGGAIVISAEDVTGEHVTHIINSPTRVLLDRSENGASVALEIESRRGEGRALVQIDGGGSLDPVPAPRAMCGSGSC